MLDHHAYLRATLRERAPWYFVLMVKAFSRNLRDSSYSITPCNTRPMLLCGGDPGFSFKTGATTKAVR